jgi:hypothetical protein
MPPANTRQRRGFAAWWEAHPRPRLALALLTLGLYAQALRLPFFLDDYRNLVLLRDGTLESSPRTAPPPSPFRGLYDFLAAPEEVREQRQKGYIPWWTDDDLRFRYFRPVAEASLHLDWLLFGGHAWGWRLTSIALYVLGAWLAFEMFRALGDERRARWAALIFAVAGRHALPVIFPASRGDMIVLVTGLASVLLVRRFLLRGGWAALAAAAVMFAVALGSKEAALALVAAPFIWWLVMRNDLLRPTRRAVIATGLYAPIAAAFLICHVIGGYGSNASPMLDPFGAPLDYLARAPLRILMMLGACLVPPSPAVLEMNARFAHWLLFWSVIAIAALALFAGLLFRRYRHEPPVLAMALWTLMFMPILACSPADDRMLILPSLGMAYLAARWLASRRPAGRLVPLASAVFLFVPLGVTGASISSVGLFEKWARAPYESVVPSLRDDDTPPIAPRDKTLFYLNSPQAFFALWPQYRAEWLHGSDTPRVVALSEAAAPEVVVAGPNTLRFRATNEPLLASHVGRMGRVRGRPRQQGDHVDVGEYAATITRVEDGRALEYEITFRRPLDWPGYRFLHLSSRGKAEIVQF